MPESHRENINRGSISDTPTMQCLVPLGPGPGESKWCWHTAPHNSTDKQGEHAHYGPVPGLYNIFSTNMVTAHSSSLGWSLLSWSGHESWETLKSEERGGLRRIRRTVGIHWAAPPDHMSNGRESHSKVMAGSANTSVNKHWGYSSTYKCEHVNRHTHIYFCITQYFTSRSCVTSRFQGHLMCH